MSKLSSLKAPLLCFFSMDFYKYIVSEGKGYGLRYIFILVSFIFLLICIYFSSILSHITAASIYLTENEYYSKDDNNPFNNFSNSDKVTKDIVDISAQMPSFKVKDGKAIFDYEEYPHCINSIANPDKYILCIDKNNQISFKDTDAKFILNEDRFIYNDPYFNRTVEFYVFNQIKDDTIDNFTLIGNINYINNAMLRIYIVISIILSVVACLISSFYGIVLYNISEYKNFGLSKESCIRLSCFANTTMVIPLTLIFIISTLFPILFNIFGILANLTLLIPIFYLYIFISKYYNR